MSGVRWSFWAHGSGVGKTYPVVPPGPILRVIVALFIHCWRPLLENGMGFSYGFGPPEIALKALLAGRTVFEPQEPIRQHEETPHVQYDGQARPDGALFLRAFV